MTLTFVLCILASTFQTFGNFFKHPLTLIFALVIMITSFCVIIGSKERRRRVPENYIWLALATLGEAFFLAATATDLKVASVISAIMATCIVVGALFFATLYTASSVDRETLIRNMVKGLIGAFFLNLVMLFVMIFLYDPKDKAVVMIISCIMVVIAGAYIIFALLFIIVPGIEDREDYILGALRLYLEIARLFFWLMKILGEKK